MPAATWRYWAIVGELQAGSHTQPLPSLENPDAVTLSLAANDERLERRDNWGRADEQLMTIVLHWQAHGERLELVSPRFYQCDPRLWQ